MADGQGRIKALVAGIAKNGRFKRLCAYNLAGLAKACTPPRCDNCGAFWRRVLRMSAA